MYVYRDWLLERLRRSGALNRSSLHPENIESAEIWRCLAQDLGHQFCQESLGLVQTAAVVSLPGAERLGTHLADFLESVARQHHQEANVLDLSLASLSPTTIQGRAVIAACHTVTKEVVTELRRISDVARAASSFSVDICGNRQPSSQERRPGRQH